jgi:hypothetical protein
LLPQKRSVFRAREIVAVDHRDSRRRQSELACQCRDTQRRPLRIGRAEVADDPDVMREAVGKHRAQERIQLLLIASRRIAPAPQLGQGQRALRECLEHQIGRSAAGDQAANHRCRRVDPIPGEAGGTADEEGSVRHAAMSRTG